MQRNQIIRTTRKAMVTTTIITTTISIIVIIVICIWLVNCYWVCQSIRRANEFLENDAGIHSQSNLDRVPAVLYTCNGESQLPLNQEDPSFDATVNTNPILVLSDVSDNQAQ